MNVNCAIRELGKTMFSSLVPVHSSGLTAPRRRRTAGIFMVALLTLTAVSFAPSTSAMAITHRPSSPTVPKSNASAWGYGTPDISLELCTSARATWFHIGVKFPGENWEQRCLGGTGTWTFGVNLVRWTCSGNNHGTITYYDSSGNHHSLGFLPGFNRDWSPEIALDTVTINGWSGSNTC